MNSLEFQESVNTSMDLLEKIELGLRSIASGDSFKSNAELIFRAFHSIKGLAKFFNNKILDDHASQIENHILRIKIHPDLADYFLSYSQEAVRSIKDLLQGKPYQLENTLPPTNILVADISPIQDKKRTIISDIPKIVIINADFDQNVQLSEYLKNENFVLDFVNNEENIFKDTKKAPSLIIYLSSKNTDSSLLIKLKHKNPEIPIIQIREKESIPIEKSLSKNGLNSILYFPIDDTIFIHSVRTAIHLENLRKTVDEAFFLSFYMNADLDEFFKNNSQIQHREYSESTFKNLLETRRNIRSMKVKIES